MTNNSCDAFVRLFYSQFFAARTLPAELNDLVDIKQEPNKPLKNYVQWFLQEVAPSKTVSDDGKLMVIMARIKVKGLLWTVLRRKTIYSTREFLDRADEFIKLEEAIQIFDQADQAGTSAAPAKNSGANFNQNLTTNESRTEVFQATQAEVPYRKPAPIGKDISKRDTNEFYRFHNDYVHDTNECNQLKDKIEFLIHQNHQAMRRYIHHPVDQQSTATGTLDALAQPLLPALVAGQLDMVCGGPHLAGDSRKALERYTQTLRHEPGEDVLAIKERTPKMPCYECKPITFTEEDANHVRFLHNDPLVIKAQIANIIVARTTVDHDCSVNILFKTTL
ncbi:uncharacterized protein LOC133806560 [Humulus lupulus]|uniref:uncharacterized protein LOC133806560 n=1 Tax=Humulus lupulus TaxID=3486 RepID=UPI002B404ED0|nr:uncharacterized protein LOC133806560 [Humulus lupulus]